jgi:hypothetical protein
MPKAKKKKEALYTIQELAATGPIEPCDCPDCLNYWKENGGPCCACGGQVTCRPGEFMLFIAQQQKNYIVCYECSVLVRLGR